MGGGSDHKEILEQRSSQGIVKELRNNMVWWL